MDSGSRTILERLHADLCAAALCEKLLLQVPEFLLGGAGTATVPTAGAEFIAAQVQRALDENGSPSAQPPELVYGVFIPTFASFGERIGSLLSFLAFLPWLRQKLWVDTIISLPLSVIGRTRKKGLRGSPFATWDPFAIDPAYADDLLPDWSAHDLYVAVLSAGRHLGVRFGTILPLATLSIDCPLLARFPDLAYWWHASPEELLHARQGPDGPNISAADRARFSDPPDIAAIRTWPAMGGGEHFAAAGGSSGPLTPANAFPDVSPEMAATYTWEDVTAVNYTALAYPVPHAQHRQAPADDRRSAWRVMPEIVAWHLRHGESALVIDVQSSVPGAIVCRGADLAASDGRLQAAPACCAAVIRPTAAGQLPWVIGEELWEFSSPAATDAVVGPFVSCAAPHARDPVSLVRSLDYHVDMLAGSGAAVRFMAGTGTHDTIPLDARIVRPLLLFLWLLPGSVPFLFSGIEHGATVPVNREFGFSRAEQDTLSYADLAMFSPAPLDWDGCVGAGQAPLVRLLQAARRVVPDCVRSGQPLTPLRPAGPPWATGYRVRGDKDRQVVVGANFGSVSAGFSHEALRAAGGDTMLWTGSGPPVPASRDSISVLPLTAFAILPRSLEASGTLHETLAQAIAGPVGRADVLRSGGTGVAGFSPWTGAGGDR
ncbi:MAG: hypothetical protein ACRDNZ_11830 [Streptosporangiaceae bacterium]